MEIQNQIIGIDPIETVKDVEKQNIISLSKFIILCILSFGTYEIWWIYKAWRFYQQKDKLDIMPIARTFFSLIFLYTLLTKILDHAEQKGYTKTYNSGMRFILFILSNFVARLPDPYWLLSLLSFVFLIPAFKALNYAKMNSEDLVVVQQDSYSSRQIFILIMGSIFWALVLIGLAL